MLSHTIICAIALVPLNETFSSRRVTHKGSSTPRPPLHTLRFLPPLIRTQAVDLFLTLSDLTTGPTSTAGGWLSAGLIIILIANFTFLLLLGPSEHSGMTKWLRRKEFKGKPVAYWFNPLNWCKKDKKKGKKQKKPADDGDEYVDGPAIPATCEGARPRVYQHVVTVVTAHAFLSCVLWATSACA